jgi:hypothetical protein
MTKAEEIDQSDEDDETGLWASTTPQTLWTL